MDEQQKTQAGETWSQDEPLTHDTEVAATASATMEAHAHEGDRHHHIPWIRRYVFSTDHKTIAVQFLLMSLFFLAVGGALASLIRWQLGFPGRPMPGGMLLPDAMMAPTPNGAVMLPEFYNSLVTMHGTIMIFFAIMPLLVGGGLREPADSTSDRCRRHGVPPPQHGLVLAGVPGGADHAGELCCGGRCCRGWVDVLRAPERERGIHRGVPGSAAVAAQPDHPGLRVPCRRRELHHDRYQHARAGHDLVPDPARDLVSVHHGHPGAARHPDPGGCVDHAALRPDSGDRLLPAGHRRRAVAVAAPVLVLRPSRGLHPDSSRHGHDVGRALERGTQAHLRLPRHGARHCVHRIPELDRVGPPHVPERDEPDARHDLHGHDHGDRRAIRDQGLQLARNDLEGRHPPPYADAARPRIRLDVHHRRTLRDLHGFDARGRLHPRHVLHRRAQSTTCSLAAASSLSSLASPSGIRRCSGAS